MSQPFSILHLQCELLHSGDREDGKSIDRHPWVAPAAKSSARMHAVNARILARRRYYIACTFADFPYSHQTKKKPRAIVPKSQRSRTVTYGSTVAVLPYTVG